MMRSSIILAQRGYLLSYGVNTGSLKAEKQYDGTNISVKNAESGVASHQCLKWLIYHQHGFVCTPQPFIRRVLIVLGP
ncbi:hypothetical protein QQF64_032736 [Cirrhinus molitorella]|uniref:Uncharacterized protein n=1 Tax=Cirrhinus molitorella TaxID=172907 RepID=A0ABR3MRW6_9TELE